MVDVLAMVAITPDVGNVDNDMHVQDVKDGWGVMSRLLLGDPQSGVPRCGPPVCPCHQHGCQKHDFAIWLESLPEVCQDGILVVQWYVRKGEVPKNVSLRRSHIKGEFSLTD